MHNQISVYIMIEWLACNRGKKITICLHKPVKTRRFTISNREFDHDHLFTRSQISTFFVKRYEYKYVKKNFLQKLKHLWLTASILDFHLKNFHGTFFCTKWKLAYFVNFLFSGWWISNIRLMQLNIVNDKIYSQIILSCIGNQRNLQAKIRVKKNVFWKGHGF